MRKVQKATDVGLFEGGRVVDTISSDSHDGSLPLTTLHDDQLLLWRGSCEHDLRVVGQDVIDLRGCHVPQVGAVDHTCLGVPVVQVVGGEKLL